MDNIWRAPIAKMYSQDHGPQSFNSSDKPSPEELFEVPYPGEAVTFVDERHLVNDYNSSSLPSFSVAYRCGIFNSSQQPVMLPISVHSGNCRQKST